MRTVLRSRFFAAIAAGSALAGASALAGGCGGSIETVPGTSSSSTTGTSSGGSTSGGSSSGGQTSPPSTGTPPSPPPEPPPPPPPEPVTCEWGQPQQVCYTHQELENQYYSPWRGGDVEPDAGPPPWDPNGCLPAKDVRDSCCNTAVAGPTPSGDRCCYVHCTGACCGRPFVVDGETRVADVIERSDWLAPAGGPAHRHAVESLDVALRDRLGRAWLNDAAMEHASVASFARFTLDLLSVGAPAELLLEAQAATRDEIEHARACFAMASRYSGRALGPGALDVTKRSGGARSLADIAAAAMIEGCVGETLSASLAEERGRRAAHPYTRAVLARIAEDEARHAELAWRFVAWAIAAGGDSVRDAVARALDEALRHPPVASDPAIAGLAVATVRAHGLLDEEAARETVARALEEIVAPCASRFGQLPRAA